MRKIDVRFRFPKCVRLISFICVMPLRKTYFACKSIAFALTVTYNGRHDTRHYCYNVIYDCLNWKTASYQLDQKSHAKTLWPMIWWWNYIIGLSFRLYVSLQMKFKKEILDRKVTFVDLFFELLHQHFTTKVKCEFFLRVIQSTANNFLFVCKTSLEIIWQGRWGNDIAARFVWCRWVQR